MSLKLGYLLIFSQLDNGILEWISLRWSAFFIISYQKAMWYLLAVLTLSLWLGAVCQVFHCKVFSFKLPHSLPFGSESLFTAHLQKKLGAKFHLLKGSNYNTNWKEGICLLSPIYIYLIILYRYGHIYFILWIIIQNYVIVLLLSFLFSFGYWEFLFFGSHVSWVFLNISLCSSTIRCS